MFKGRTVKIFRYFGLFLGLGTVVYLVWAPEGGMKWFLSLAVWLLFVLAVLVRNIYIYRIMYRNFSIVAAQAHGNMQKGGYVFFTPPIVSFIHKGRKCSVRYSVDSMLDCLFEYILPVEREAELKFTRIKGDDLGRRFKVGGADFRLEPFLAKDKEAYAAVDALLDEFDEVYVGRDRKIRLVAACTIAMSNPRKLFSRFDKAVLLANFLEETVKQR